KFLRLIEKILEERLHLDVSRVGACRKVRLLRARESYRSGTDDISAVNGCLFDRDIKCVRLKPPGAITDFRINLRGVDAEELGPVEADAAVDDRLKLFRIAAFSARRHIGPLRPRLFAPAVQPVINIKKRRVQVESDGDGISGVSKAHESD